MSMYERLFARLNQAGVRYVVVGGVAVVLHGYARLTADVDLVIDLDPENVRLAIEVLQACGLRPLLPVEPFDFAVEEKRRDWIETKNLEVFSMRDPRNPMLTVDLFAREPIPFADLRSRATVVELGQERIAIASISDLIDMKRAANRAQDRIDIEQLEAIRREGKS